MENRNLLEPVYMRVGNPTPPVCDVCASKLGPVAIYDMTLVEGDEVGELLCIECFTMLKSAFYYATMAQPELMYLHNYDSIIKN